MKETNFKSSALGPIPHDWGVKSLGDIGEVQMCKRIFNSQTSTTGEIPFYKIGTLGKDPDAYITRSLYEEFRSKYNFPKKGELLISAAGTIGRTIIYSGQDCYYQDSNIVWLRHNEDIVSNKFLNFVFRVINWQSQDGGTISRLYNTNFRATSFSFPIDKTEQQRIAKALTDVDELIDTTEKLLQKKRDIKTGAMQQLLTGKLRLPGFTLPWVEITLGKIGNTYNGLSGKTKSDFGHGTAQFITFVNIIYNTIIDSSIFEKVDVREDEKQNKAILGDLFFNTSSETPDEAGMCSYLNDVIENLYLNSFCFGFRIYDNNVNPLFLAYFFRTSEGRQMMSKIAPGVTRFNISKKLFKTLSLYIPSDINEQNAITKVLTDMDAEIESLELNLTKYQSIREAMMQQLLTGKIRLI